MTPRKKAFIFAVALAVALPRAAVIAQGEPESPAEEKPAEDSALAVGGEPESPAVVGPPAPVLDPRQQAVRAAAEASGAEVLRFYDGRDYALAWTSHATLVALNDAAWKVGSEGIPRTLIGIREFREAMDANPGDAIGAVAARDVAATELALRYINWMREGVADPTKLHPKWERVEVDPDGVAFLSEALARPPGEFAEALGAAIRTDAPYMALKEALIRYRKIKDDGGWERTAEPDEPVKVGDPYPDAVALRTRLQVEGDLAAEVVPARVRTDPETRDPLYDEETAEAVKVFQIRHGIEPDGILGPQTVSELNVSASARERSLEINLERMRWMPAEMDDRYVIVNIARSALAAYAGGELVTTMRVIVGEQGGDRHTPVFHNAIEYLIFRPYWNIPVGIAKEEIVPKQRADWGYFGRNHYEIVPGYGAAPGAGVAVTGATLAAADSGSLFVRQKPGKHNALGLIKFIFPNDSAVYLHDTSAPSLFQRTNRDFSHGCVRVEQPAELGAWALGGDGIWSPAKISQMMNDESVHNKQINLEAPLPVYLVYWTASIDENGTIHFDQDIYGHDPKTAAAMGM